MTPILIEFVLISFSSTNYIVPLSFEKLRSALLLHHYIFHSFIFKRHIFLKKDYLHSN